MTSRIAVLSLLAILVGVLAYLLLARDNESGEPNPTSVSAFDDAERGSDDVLPQEETRFMAGLAKPIDSVLATSDGSVDYYIARGKDHGYLCLISVGVGATGGSCSPRSSLKRDGAVWSADIHDSDGEVTVSAILPDGYDEVELGGVTGDVRNNVAVISGEANLTLETHGPSVETRQIHLGL